MKQQQYTRKEAQQRQARTTRQFARKKLNLTLCDLIGTRGNARFSKILHEALKEYGL